MAVNEDRPRLRALNGGASTSQSTTGALLLSAKPHSGAATQLSLTITALKPATLVLTSMAELERRGLDASLRRFAVHHFVDLRLGPFFRPFGFDREGFFDLLADLGVRYEHLAALADPHMGDAWHEERYRQLIEGHYQEQTEALRELRGLIDNGPVMLLVPSYVDQAQGALLRALNALGPSFAYIQIGSERNDLAR